jgi:hypothetical protein
MISQTLGAKQPTTSIAHSHVCARGAREQAHGDAHCKRRLTSIEYPPREITLSVQFPLSVTNGNQTLVQMINFSAEAGTNKASSVRTRHIHILRRMICIARWTAGAVSGLLLCAEDGVQFAFPAKVSVRLFGATRRVSLRSATLCADPLHSCARILLVRRTVCHAHLCCSEY